MFAFLARTHIRAANAWDQINSGRSMPVWLDRFIHSLIDFAVLSGLATLFLCLLEAVEPRMLVRQPSFWGGIPFAFSIAAFLVDDAASRYRDEVHLADSPDRLKKSAFCEFGFLVWMLSLCLPLAFGFDFGTARFLGTMPVVMVGLLLFSLSLGGAIGTSAFKQWKLAAESDRPLTAEDTATIQRYAAKRGRAQVLAEAIVGAGGTLTYANVAAVVTRVRRAR